MNELAKQLNTEERDGLAAVLAMDINDMRDSHIDHLKARVAYLTDAEKARFPFLSETKQVPKVKKLTPLDQE